jgi:hypothetical protein
MAELSELGRKMARWPGKSPARVSRDEAMPLGPLNHERHNDMALHCYPQPYHEDGCPTDDSDGMTHAENQPCPFAKDGLPRTCFDTCCSLYAENVVDELFALGEERLADRLLRDMTPKGAVRFARDLRRMADRLEREVTDGRRQRPRGAGHNGRYDSSRRRWVYERYSTFEQALVAIRAVVPWFENVGKLGFGVRAENRTLVWLREE